MHPIEKINRRLIPFALVILLFLIIAEIFFSVEDPTLLLLFELLDITVVCIFAIDLWFLARKARSGREFVKEYWLDILAVFPFSLMFSFLARLFQSASLAERVVVGQAIVHESIETEKVIADSGKIGHFVKIAARSLRLISKSKSKK